MRSSIALRQSLPEERWGVLDCGARRESLLARSRSVRAFFMRSSHAFLKSSREERCGVRDCGLRWESLLARSRASRAFFMRSSKALRQSLPEERWGVRDGDEFLERESRDCGARRESRPDCSRACPMRCTRAFCSSSCESRCVARDEPRVSEPLDCAPRSLLPRPRSWASVENTAMPAARKNMLNLLMVFILCCCPIVYVGDMLYSNLINVRASN